MSAAVIDPVVRAIEEQRAKVEKMRKELARDNAKLFYGELLTRWKELQNEVKQLSKLERSRE